MHLNYLFSCQIILGWHHQNMHCILYMFVYRVVQDYSIVYNNAVRPVISSGWHFTRMWKTLEWPQHFTKEGGLAHKTSSSPPLFIEVPVPSQECEQSYIFVLEVSFLPLSTIFLLEFWSFVEFSYFPIFHLSNYSWMKSWNNVLYLIYVHLQLPLLQIKDDRKRCSVSICLDYFKSLQRI